MADNVGSGVSMRNAPSVSGGEVFLLHCTVANNDEYGIKVGGATLLNRPNIQNTIVWGNGSGSDVIDDYEDVHYFFNNDWEGLAGAGGCGSPDAQGNVNTNPNFVNAGAGDYHLDETYSCLIELGLNSPYGSVILTELDIDRQDRILGDDTDIGFDEVPAE